MPPASPSDARAYRLHGGCVNLMGDKTLTLHGTNGRWGSPGPAEIELRGAWFGMYDQSVVLGQWLRRWPPFSSALSVWGVSWSGGGVRSTSSRFAFR